MTPAPTTSETTAPETTSSPADTTTPTTNPPSPDGDLAALYESASPLVPNDAPCEPTWSDLTEQADEVTFARNGDLFTFDPETGTLRCLAHVDREPIGLDWNPAGDRLLVDQDLIIDADGQHPSGFEPGTLGQSWSRPLGTALIAPSADGTSLRHIDAEDPSDETDVSSLTETWAAAYHPSGMAIVSAGIDQNGTRGVFLADNQGDDPRTLIFLEDPATRISEIAFAHDGEWVTFVHDHTGGAIDEGVLGHIHRIRLEGLVLEDLQGFPDVVPRGLIASEQVDGTIAWQLPHSTNHVETTTWDGVATRSLRFPETAVDPVGFLDHGTAATVVFPLDGAGNRQLWLFPPEGPPVLIARGVTAASTRTVHFPDWSDPPLNIDLAAVG